jgi:hypothetical protein
MINGISAIQSGLSTVRRGVDRLDKAASELSLAYLPLDEETQAALGPDKPDVVGSLVEMMLARRQVEVGARVIDRASQTEQSLLDIIA